MTGFSEDWLALRESADTEARSVQILTILQAWTRQFSRLNITDLGAGTGSNLRYLAPRLGGEQQWQLVDDDPTLLAALPTLLSRWGERQQVTVLEQADSSLHLEGASFSARIRRVQRDLAEPLADDLLDGQHLVTASALLDLTSREWMEGLVERLAEQHASRLAKGSGGSSLNQSSNHEPESDQTIACLFALSVDGRIQWHPELPVDEQIREAFNRHQQSDKGLGVAAGPHAGSNMANALQRVGFDVFSDTSDWHLGTDAAPMQAALADGFLNAALELSEKAALEKKSELQRWHSQRRNLWEAAQSTLMVGHLDVLGLPRSASLPA